MCQAPMKPVSILLVEDDQIDAKAFMRAMETQRISNPVIRAKDGVDAWEILKGMHGDTPLARPHIIILDINMPRMSGIELLRKLRGDEDLRDSIVFVLTTSNDDQDKIEAYNLNVAGYMLKSDMANGFLKAVELIDKYWRVVELPASRMHAATAA
ncbi:MAG: response regulator [Chromatiales bacterium]|nr:MAG: response regulator [Chromatiales bacterium]